MGRKLAEDDHPNGLAWRAARDRPRFAQHPCTPPYPATVRIGGNQPVVHWHVNCYIAYCDYSPQTENTMICASNSTSGRLNAFQRLMLQWSELHPYNAAHVYRIARPMAPEALAEAIHILTPVEIGIHQNLLGGVTGQ